VKWTDTNWSLGPGESRVQIKANAGSLVDSISSHMFLCKIKLRTSQCKSQGCEEIKGYLKSFIVSQVVGSYLDT